MSEIQYSPDKPKDCKYCYWYEKRKGCTFGEHCYYEVKPEPKRSPCDGCSYAVPHPCIGYCMKRWDKVYKQRVREQLANGRAEDRLEPNTGSRRRLEASDQLS